MIALSSIDGQFTVTDLYSMGNKLPDSICKHRYLCSEDRLIKPFYKYISTQKLHITLTEQICYKKGKRYSVLTFSWSIIFVFS